MCSKWTSPIYSGKEGDLFLCPPLRKPHRKPVKICAIPKHRKKTEAQLLPTSLKPKKRDSFLYWGRAEPAYPPSTLPSCGAYFAVSGPLEIHPTGNFLLLLTAHRQFAIMPKHGSRRATLAWPNRK